jgi:hypothetical protein
MSEAYVLIAGSQVEPYLQQVWVKGPGAAAPGEVLLLPAEEDKIAASRLLIDLAVVPVEHGLCTFKPVAGGAGCPFGRACHSCEHFVLTGTDYTYWKRQEQRQAALAEGAPSQDARDYLYQAFEPSSQAIAGLEKALTAAGLLEDARQLDLRSPYQDSSTRSGGPGGGQATRSRSSPGSTTASPSPPRDRLRAATRNRRSSDRPVRNRAAPAEPQTRAGHRRPAAGRSGKSGAGRPRREVAGPGGCPPSAAPGPARSLGRYMPRACATSPRRRHRRRPSRSWKPKCR